MVKPIYNVSKIIPQAIILLLVIQFVHASWSPKQYTSESSAVTNSIPYKEAKGPDKQLIQKLLPTILQLREIDEKLYDLRIVAEEERQLKQLQLELSHTAIEQFGLHTGVLKQAIEQVRKDSMTGKSRAVLLNSFPQTLNALADVYFRSGYLQITTEGEIKKNKLASWLPFSSSFTKAEEAFFQIFTAASLAHKRARFSLAIYLENGLFPDRQTIQMATSEDQKYHYLWSLVDPKKSVLFKYLEQPDKQTSFQTLSAFEADTKAQAITNLYLSAQLSPPKVLYDYMQSVEFDDQLYQDSRIDAAQYSKISHLAEQNKRMSIQSAPAQMSLGTRFQHGISTKEDCETSTIYYEAAARTTVDFIDKTFGLIGPDKKQLKLMGPYAISEQMSFSKTLTIENFYASMDVVELLNLQGAYGSAESLNFLGWSTMHGKGKMERDFKKAYQLFEKALEIEPNNPTANYCIGLLYMLGLIEDQPPNAAKAVSYLQKAGDDPRALNALGVIYYIAPEIFETDPVRLSGFAGIKRDVKKALRLLNQSAEKGNVQAFYNQGAIHLDEDNKEMFSFSKAYDKFKEAATYGHTLSGYNLGVMHYTGLGTFKSCNVANAFLKHVVTMGENSIYMTHAYKLVEQERYLEALWLYMEQAEMGQGYAALNAGLLLEKFDIFDTSKTLLGDIASEEFNKDNQEWNSDGGNHQQSMNRFNLNKQLAFRYFQMALYQKDTEDEASLKLAEFMYYGTAGLQDFEQALSIYKVVEEQTRDAEVKGHALFKLGMMHQFGDGGVLDIDHDMAQLYYDKALKAHSTVVAPAYIMTLYSKWQRLNVLDTVGEFVYELIEEPWSRGMMLLIAQIFYVLILWSTVKFLRKESIKDEQ